MRGPEVEEVAEPGPRRREALEHGQAGLGDARPRALQGLDAIFDVMVMMIVRMRMVVPMTVVMRLVVFLLHGLPLPGAAARWGAAAPLAPLECRVPGQFPLLPRPALAKPQEFPSVSPYPSGTPKVLEPLVRSQGVRKNGESL